MQATAKTAEDDVPPEILTALLSHLADFAYLFDCNGRFVFANRALLELLGLSLPTIVGKNFHDLGYPPSLASRLQRQISEVVSTGRPMKDETPFTGVSGQSEYYEYLFTPVFDTEGRVHMVAGSTRNISSRIQAEQRLDAALIAGEIGTWIYEVPENRVFADKNLARFFGVTDADANGGSLDKYLKAIHPEDLARVNATISDALTDGSEFESQYRLVTAAAQRTVLARGRIERDAMGQAVRMPGVILDLTDQRRVESQLAEAKESSRRDLAVSREASEKLRVAQEHLGLAITASGIGTWHVVPSTNDVEGNEVFREHFGKTKLEKLTIATCLESVHSEDRPSLESAMADAIDHGTEYDAQYRTTSKDGRLRWIRALGRTYRGTPDDILQFHGITIDTTNQMNASAERAALFEAEQSARQQAERTSQLKDEFLATLSHELRTPLTAILGWTQILRSSANVDQDIRTGLETIERNARAQTRIIDDLLDMSRIVSGKVRLDVQPVELPAILEAAIETTRPAAEAKQIKFQSVIDPLISAVNGDPNRLHQVFWNLLSNAVKFTPRGGSVKVLLERVNSHLEVSIIDNGAGIDPEFLPNVFDRFRQADGSNTRAHGGLGLGLAIVKQLVELHGGGVSARSPGAGSGSTFVVSLPSPSIKSPRFTDHSERRHPHEEFAKLPVLPATLNLRGVTALLVDDESESRILVSRLLTDAGACVITADSADKAFDLLVKERPSVIVSDIGMPHKNGYDLIRQIRQLAPGDGGNTPAVALTAYARSEDRTKALLAGFQMHVAKPIEAAELLTTIASLTGHVPK
jgi:PAS domain S-box-containing protein